MLTRLPPHAAATLHLLLVGILAAIATTARAQVVVLPHCNFQEVDLVPCMAAGAAATATAGAGGGGNISDACCSSLNKALDAGHRCVCSLLLSNGVFASLVTNLLTLPLVLPLAGCFLFAPSLAACQATLQQQQTSAQPAAAASTGAGAGATLPSPTQAAAAATPRAGREQADDGKTRGSNGDGSSSSEAPSPAGSVSRSDACRHRPSSDEGRACMLTFAAAIAVFWFNRMTDS